MIFSMNEIVCAFPSLYLSEPSSLTVTANVPLTPTHNSQRDMHAFTIDTFQHLFSMNIDCNCQ